jgi:glutamyl-tRNA reductase
VARIDKSQSNLNHRAPLAADVSSSADYDKVLGVGINTSGQAVLKAASNSGFVGITIVDRTKRRAGQIIDILSLGEIVEVAGLVAGTKYYLTAGGLLSATRSTSYVGYTIEADRLVVEFDSEGADV